MRPVKRYKSTDVLTEAVSRISETFDSFERIYVSFSAGKDSTVLLHLAVREAIKRDRKIGVLFVDLEAQYSATIEHARNCFELYKDHIEFYWVCLPISLRNAVSNFEPQWRCWDPDCKDLWVRQPPAGAICSESFFPFFQRGMEFEEFVPLFGKWFSQEKNCACLVGIRTDESLNRFRTIASKTKDSFESKSYTTLLLTGLYNVYPLYDWAVSDIWLFHARHPALPYNKIYDLMHRAGLTLAQMRICQPYGDEQRRGLWLYHILEPDTWYKVVSRVSGANSGALYQRETGNVSGYRAITKPAHHTWKSFCHVLLASLPGKTREHYTKKFQTFIAWWRKNGYPDGIPDEADRDLENKRKAPSYRRLCKVILRNDYWCKGLSFAPPKSSSAYRNALEIKKILTLAHTDSGEDKDLA